MASVATTTAANRDVAQALTALWAGDITGAGQFAISPTGTLAWVPGQVVPYPEVPLVAVDRRGHVTPPVAPQRSHFPWVRVSSDGRRLAVKVQTMSEIGLWVLDLERGTLSPLVGEGEVGSAIWSPDGRQVVLQWRNDGRDVVAILPSDGSAPLQVLRDGCFIPADFTPDGQRLVGWVCRADRLRIGTMTIADGQARPPDVIQGWSTLSSDGRWLAYGSSVSGRDEVYVRRDPGPGPAAQVSLDGGSGLTWTPNGRELFFLGRVAAEKAWLMAADFAPGARIGRPHPLFEFRGLKLRRSCTESLCYDVSPDGQRF